MLGNHSISHIFLEVRESNIAAQKLYEKYGFCNIAMRKAYYTDTQENAYIYEKKLKQPET